MSVALSEVRRAARAHLAPLAGESAGYLVLAIADEVLSAPRVVSNAQVLLTEDGGLRVLSAEACSDAEAERSLRQLLDNLLLVASSGSAALTRASRRVESVGLSLLVRELEAALIPVNRGAARRALARMHRETARALASGALPAEPECAAQPSVPEPQVESHLTMPAVLEVAIELSDSELQVEAELDDEAGAEVRDEPESEAEADCVSTAPPACCAPEPVAFGEEDEPTSVLPIVRALATDTQLDFVLTALSDELLLPPELQDSEPLTEALQVRSVAPPNTGTQPDLALHVHAHLSADSKLDVEAEFDSSAAPTVMLVHEVAPVVAPTACAEQSSWPPATEACTRPEPVMLRRATRSELVPKRSASTLEALSATPTLGSLAAALPILDRDQIAELSFAPRDEPAHSPHDQALDGVLCSADYEEYTEQMPEVEPLSPAEALVVSKKSCVTELVSTFQVGPDDSNQGLCRAIKEMADLDLTPAPFAALIR